jgi:hypothetical protein
MDDKIVSLIEKFYDDPANVSKNFGGPASFIKFILSKGDKYSEYLDPKNQFFYDEDLQDLLIWKKYQAAEDKQQFLKEFVVEFLDSDMDVESGGKISWVIDKEDVLLAFYDIGGRGGGAKSAAEMVFNDDFNEHFSDVIDDFYDECIRTLNDKNESLLANKIVSELPPLNSEDIERTSFLEELWEIEGQPETLRITADNITELLEDEKTTKYIIKNFFPDLRSDMESAYWNAFNTAYEDELSKNVYGGLEGFFGDSGKMVNVGTNRAGNDIWTYVIDVTNTFDYLFREYFMNWRNNYNSIEYYGSFKEMLNELFNDGLDRIDFRIPDYPDFDDVKDAYNEYVEI